LQENGYGELDRVVIIPNEDETSLRHEIMHDVVKAALGDKNKRAVFDELLTILYNYAKENDKFCSHINFWGEGIWTQKREILVQKQVFWKSYPFILFR